MFLFKKHLWVFVNEIKIFLVFETFFFNFFQKMPEKKFLRWHAWATIHVCVKIDRMYFGEFYTRHIYLASFNQVFQKEKRWLLITGRILLLIDLTNVLQYKLIFLFL